ncbi:MAG: methyltransferase [Actinobacteria bacterium]|nr:methyltransferase [Actinomycetota bacterium]
MSSERSEPNPDRAAAQRLGVALRRVGYDEDAVGDLLGDEGASTDLAEVPVHERRLPGSPLATAIRLFLLQLPVTLGAAVDALGQDGADALLALGLAAVEGDELVPHARIVPAEELYMAFDGFARGAEDPVGYVAPYTPTASWLAALTPRRHFTRALDVGTGNGVHALLAARHCDHVIATDVNERALAFTEINAALNELDNIETRLGSLFEPVAGETFDLITCNAPYVVSPESKWQYRDGGLPADEISERVVRQASASLADDGFATLLVSWVAVDEEAPDDRLDDWLDGSGCDAWVLGMTGSDPLEHAAGWNEHLSDDPRAYGAALDEWVGYFDSLGLAWVSEGAVVLHKRAAEQNVIRVDPVDADELEFAGEQIERVFSSHARLDGLDDEGLLGQTVVLASDVRVERVADPGSRDSDTVLFLDEGTNVEYELDPDVAEVIGVLDGGLTLGRAIDRVSRAFELDRGEIAELRRDSLDEVRDLLALGIAELR